MKMMLPAEIPQGQDIGQGVVGSVFNDELIRLQAYLSAWGGGERGQYIPAAAAGVGADDEQVAGFIPVQQIVSLLKAAGAAGQDGNG